ncbi:TPA: lipopolysaccharide biosynthesis protein [Photobacterium damselae]
MNNLGIDDFGIYNVVAGIVMMMSFLTGSMTSAIQRFMSFELGGSNNEKRLNQIFSISLNVHLLIVFLVLIIAETIGIWFINNKLNFPPDRIDAVNWIFQCSIISFTFTIVSISYIAILISHEKMNVFATIGIIEVGIKLSFVMLLNLDWIDKLEIYGTFTACTSIIIFLIYYIYCKIKFSISKYKLLFDISLTKEIFSYVSWSLFGNLSVVATNQGINILLNVFFGPHVNAARAIAYQVNSAISSFVSNLQLSINPQIIKSYSNKNLSAMNDLIFYGAKYSYFLLFLLSLPMLFRMEYILKLWLEDVPNDTKIFCQLILIDALITSLSGTIITAVQATGRIKYYQITVGGILLLNLPISFIFLKLGYPAYSVMIITILISIFALISRFIFLYDLLQIKIKFFLSQVIYRCLLTSIPVVFIIYYLNKYISYDFLGFTLLVISSFFISTVSIYNIGLNNIEREYFLNFVRNKVRARV